MKAITRFRAVVVATAALLAPLAAQDSLQLKDGRFVLGPTMTRKADGVVVHYKYGDVFVANDLIREVSASKSDVPNQNQDRVPKDSEEKLAAGYVRFEGNWVKPEQRDKTLAARRYDRAKKIKAAQARREWRNREKLETANFRFEYTIDPEVVKGYAELMETYYRTFTKEWGISKPSKEGKLTVCFYHDHETFSQVSGAGGGVIGYYRFMDPKELDFFYDRKDERLTIDVMFHETNHYLTHLIDLKFGYPPWINESLAEYYGASEWDAKNKKMVVGALQDGRLAVIQSFIMDDKWQKLSELIALKHGEFNADHYAWGWSFVHFLLSTPKYASRFKSFYKSLASDPSVRRVHWQADMKTVEPEEVEKALKRYLSVSDLSALEKEWHDYVKGLRQSSPRGLAEAGQLYFQKGMVLKATRYFSTAIEKGYDTASTYEWLARCHSSKGKKDDAIAALKKAIEKDPLEGSLYLALARTQAPLMSEADEETRKLCKLAFEVSPDDPSLWLFGFFDEKLAKEIEEEFAGG
jgi:tetratricopeptide (TPR) repeat protein